SNTAERSGSRMCAGVGAGAHLRSRTFSPRRTGDRLGPLNLLIPSERGSSRVLRRTKYAGADRHIGSADVSRFLHVRYAHAIRAVASIVLAPSRSGYSRAVASHTRVST